MNSEFTTTVHLRQLVDYSCNGHGKTIPLKLFRDSLYKFYFGLRVEYAEALSIYKLSEFKIYFLTLYVVSLLTNEYVQKRVNRFG